jgi:hypothetical protein
MHVGPTNTIVVKALPRESLHTKLIVCSHMATRMNYMNRIHALMAHTREHTHTHTHTNTHTHTHTHTQQE